MADRNELITYLDGLLDIASFSDYAPNGLQVPGTDRVDRVVTGVSANLALIAAAADRGADLIVVHHGLFWNNAPRSLDGPMARKLRLLLDNDISLAAYHLPLDGHQAHGNNALLAAALGADSWSPFAQHGGNPLGVAAVFDEPLRRSEFVDRVRAATGGREPLAFPDGPDLISTAGIVSGAAADHLQDAIAAGLDAFVTGEPAERVMATAAENAITFVAAGHYATETYGVRRLGELLARDFAVSTEFVDVPNPI